MDAYEQFQRTLAEMKAKIQREENKTSNSIPPGFEGLFNMFGGL